MSKFASLARRCATGLVAAQLMFGAVSVTTLTLAAPAHAAVAEPTLLLEHDDWQGFTTTVDGQQIAGAMSRMRKGGLAIFTVAQDEMKLLLSDPSWNFEDGTVPVLVTIDGQGYTFTAKVHGNTIAMSNVRPEVFKMFAAGAQAEISVDGGAIVWKLDLDGFSASMLEAVKTIQA